MTPPAHSSDDTDSITRIEISLRRALATTDSSESRYHIRTALQQLQVVRETGGIESSEYGDARDMNHQ
ncbi:hypothetical protein ACFQFH_01495 [Halobaculum halobium]|uniref:Uncharacterized protein n=1 Tax=Halobaculum halobium TaxID=3032281 RepID=A0ABD5T944_9EURY|nr:hypothetical protein [Halobaculum sp. SYNS20]